MKVHVLQENTESGADVIGVFRNSIVAYRKLYDLSDEFEDRSFSATEIDLDDEVEYDKYVQRLRSIVESNEKVPEGRQGLCTGLWSSRNH